MNIAFKEELLKSDKDLKDAEHLRKIYPSMVNGTEINEIKKNDKGDEAMNEIDRWIKYIKEHPAEWKKAHTEFINAQFKKSEEFIKRLLKEPGGKERLINAYGIKNLKGYEGLLK